MQSLNASQTMSASTMKKIVLTSLLAATVLAVAGSARAESNFQTGVGALTGTTHLDFQIIVPKMLYLRVGTGVDRTTVATVDLISFTVPAANVGDASVIAGTGGDLTGGVVTARVLANNGTVTLTTATPNQLKDVAGDLISFSQIGLAVATLTTATAFTPPAMTDNTTTNSTIAPTLNVVNRDAKWTFTYLNTNVVAAGTYGGVNINNSRVTYTASIL
jgi:hypothetical protein